jgi:hypothetical protein
VPGHGVDAVLAARPELRAPFEQLLERLAAAARPIDVEQLRRDAPEDFALLTFVVAGGYLQDPQVQSALGYAGRVPAPLDEPDADTTFEAALLGTRARSRSDLPARRRDTPPAVADRWQRSDPRGSRFVPLGHAVRMRGCRTAMSPSWGGPWLVR